MTRFVLDASVALAWFIDSPIPSYAAGVKNFLLGGARAVVPALWHLEMANGFAVARRRGILTSADANRGMTRLDQLLSQVIESAVDFVPMRQAYNTVVAFQLSAYDAVYFDMARREGLPLATLDRRLLAAARQAGIISLA